MSREVQTPQAAKKRERKCVASGDILPENQLIRFAVGPEGVLAPDVAAKLPGRGVWTRARREAVETAVRKGGFARSLKGPVRAPDGLADQTCALLSRRCLEQLGLMRRAGALALGAEGVESAIRARPALMLIEAADGAEDGRNKLLNLHIGLWKAPAPLAGCFTASELGMALGRPRVIHACVLQERMALHWAADLGRLAGFRAIVPDSWPDSWRGLGLSGAGA
jgi:uncharacterized protein